MPSAFGKMALLLTSKAKQAYAGHVCADVLSTLTANEVKIKTTLNVVPRGYILVTDAHPSKSDPKPHYTVDAYHVDESGSDKPIGCIHVYKDGTVFTFDEPRSKAEEAYKNRAV